MKTTKEKDLRVVRYGRTVLRDDAILQWSLGHGRENLQRLGSQRPRGFEELKGYEEVWDSRELKTQGKDKEGEGMEDRIPLEILAYDPYAYSKA